MSTRPLPVNEAGFVCDSFPLPFLKGGQARFTEAAARLRGAGSVQLGPPKAAWRGAQSWRSSTGALGVRLCLPLAQPVAGRRAKPLLGLSGPGGLRGGPRRSSRASSEKHDCFILLPTLQSRALLITSQVNIEATKILVLIN